MQLWLAILQHSVCPPSTQTKARRDREPETGGEAATPLIDDFEAAKRQEAGRAARRLASLPSLQNLNHAATAAPELGRLNIRWADRAGHEANMTC
jgi:hypothetical protein